MYYIKTLEDRICIPPSLFGSKLTDAVLSILRERYEGRIYKDLGIVLSVNEPEILSDGVVIPGDSGAYYTVGCQALTFIPLVNEVFRADIKEIVEFGAFASIGPFQGLLHISQIDREKFYYDKKNKSLGSKALKRTLKKGDEALVKVSTVSLKSTSSDTKIGLTMRPDGLGRPDWIEKPVVKKKGGKK
ncbi:DNA-directed RNA polymerase [Candidatus Micrarchaeota archaeon]|nr:DNA-directed RNA polymerase [Candidatus Micrarchaeota archaeon]